MILVSIIVITYIVLGLCLDMFNVYYCIKYLNEKESINLIHILIWPFASIYSIIQLTKKLSGKYTDLMIDVYGDKKLIEDKKSKKKDKLTITTTNFINNNKYKTYTTDLNAYIVFRVISKIDCHTLDSDAMLEIINLCHYPDEYIITIYDEYLNYINAESIRLIDHIPDNYNLSMQVIFELKVKKSLCLQLNGDTLKVVIKNKDKSSHHIDYGFKCKFVSGKDIVEECVIMQQPMTLKE